MRKNFFIIVLLFFLPALTGFTFFKQDPVPLTGLYSLKGKTLTYFDLISKDIALHANLAELTDSKPDDLKIETYRSTGRGGQHVNTTDSAVRITHIPTGTVAQCQNERSQHRNKDMAMKFLRSRLYELELRKRREAADKLEAAKADIDFGSQIRSYVLHPYRLIKDHRTKFEMGDTDRVLDGDIDPFLKAYLLSRRTVQKPA